MIKNQVREERHGNTALVPSLMIYEKHIDELKQIGKVLGYRGEHIYVRYEKVSEIVNSLCSLQNEPKTLLHAGCGFGLLDHYLSTKFDIHGIDISTEEINQARKLAEKFGRSFVYEIGDILNYKPGIRFDVVVCSEVIEHIPASEKKILNSLKSFVANEGFLVITVPNKNQLRNRVRRLFGLPDVLMDKTHIKEYSYAEIEKILQDSGLVVEKKDAAVLYFPLERFVKYFVSPSSFIRSFLIRIFPQISSHLIFVCKTKRHEKFGELCFRGRHS